jgi:aldehyde dehydrogenase (NAD(P)+)
VNAYLGPFIEEAFADAIARHFLAVAYGGAEEGAYLAQHAGIDEIHLTGSDKTYDTLVWGPPGPERDLRKARNTPLLTKPVTAELGNISPVLVVPGPYSDKELAFQAESVAGAVASNASFLCNSAKMLVTPKGWGRRPALLASIERALATAPVRRAYYPGAEARWRSLTRGREARFIGAGGEGYLPWTLLTGLDAADVSEPAFSTEPFCSILSETEVGSDDPVEYLDRAVDFVNNRLWGTLSTDLIVHPTLLRDSRIADAVERAITRLRYGAVTLNSWTGYIFAFGTPPWGAHPSSSAADIQSGSGWVHNTSMLEGVEKAVLQHPLTIVPKPATFPSHRSAHTLMRRMTFLEERASWSKVPGVVMAAMRG